MAKLYSPLAYEQLSIIKCYRSAYCSFNDTFEPKSIRCLAFFIQHFYRGNIILILISTQLVFKIKNLVILKVGFEWVTFKKKIHKLVE